MARSETSVDVVPGNKVPLYLQVAQELKKRVRTGTYRSSHRLPSIRRLGQEFGVTASVVHRAVRELERHGVVTTQHGRGMVLAAEDPCEKAAIVFGFVHPYAAHEEFNRAVLGYVNEAFEDRANLVVTRTSRNDAAREREAADHLIGNGVKGLLIWSVSNDLNGPHFAELAKKIPIVLVDRFLDGADLPAVALDHRATGQEIGEHLLGALGRKRLLVLMDDLRISAYREMIDGFRIAARRLGREADLTVVQYPMLEVVDPVTHRDFSRVDIYRDRVEQLLREGGYDALFTNHGQFLDRVVIETGLAQTFGHVQLATLSNRGMHTGSRRFTEVAPLLWDMDMAEMIGIAADILQQQVMGGRRETRIVRLPMRRLPHA